MRIAFADVNDPRDPHSWSGIPSRMIEGFANHAEVEVVGGLKRGIREIYTGHKLLYRSVGRRFDEHRTRFSLELYSRRLGKALSAARVDAVVAPGSLPVARLGLAKPTVFWTDACFGGMLEYYEDFTALCSRSRLDGDAQERAALARCHAAIYASSWAADQCRRLYPEHAHKVRTVPFGANLDPSYDADGVTALIERREAAECRLLFIGIDWTRKGGETALAAARYMNAVGLPTTLTVVGCEPFRPGTAPPFVEIVGFVSRGTPAGRQRLEELFRRSHFLLLPSRAEAFGIVLCEAAAFGVPSFASATGGIPSIIDDGGTGRLLPEQADGQRYGEALHALFKDRARYRAMALAAYRKYRRELTWDSACKSVLELVASAI